MSQYNPRGAMIESMENRLHLDASQLTTSIVSSSLPASVSDQSIIKGLVVLNVANNSGTLQKFKAQLQVLFGDQVLASKPGQISLTVGQSKLFTLTVKIPKAKLADGTHALIGQVTQVGGGISQSADGSMLQVRAPIIALSETQLFRKLPATIAPGAKFNTTDLISIANTGSDPSADPLVISVYATTDGAVAGATLLKTITRKGVINAGRTVVAALPIKAPAGLPAGQYKFIATVNQANGTVTTTDPALSPVLNVPAPITVPQFVDSILTVTPQYVTPTGGTETLSSIDVQMFIENKGVSSDGSSQYALFVSKSSTFDSSAVQIESLPLSQFIPGGNSGQGFQVDFGIPQPSPVKFDGSDYYIYVQVTDPKGAVTLGSAKAAVAIR